jgi:hypothetical protein
VFQKVKKYVLQIIFYWGAKIKKKKLAANRQTSKEK